MRQEIPLTRGVQVKDLEDEGVIKEGEQLGEEMYEKIDLFTLFGYDSSTNSVISSIQPFPRMNCLEPAVHTYLLDAKQRRE